jgi:hypothetical protein
MPIGYPIGLKTDESGATIWMKTGHLKDVEQQIQRVNATIK